jgi:predicted amidophosphoribosyltransferase
VNTGSNEELDYVAVIDDVVTTTATANAVARVLRAEGASRIDVWALARA